MLEDQIFQCWEQEKEIKLQLQHLYNKDPDDSFSILIQLEYF